MPLHNTLALSAEDRLLTTLSRCRVSLLVLLFVMVNLPIHLWAQADFLPKVGIKTFGIYDYTNIDSVDLGSGNLNLHIPLIGFPQKGGKLRLNFMIRYNEPQWYLATGAVLEGQNGPQTTGEWSIGNNSSFTPRPLGVDVVRDQGITEFFTETQREAAVPGNEFKEYTSVTYGVRDRTGAEHLVRTDPGFGGGIQSVALSPDGSGWLPIYHVVPDNVYIFDGYRDKDGLLYTSYHPSGVPGNLPAWNITDAHNNTITTAADGWHDSVGRLIPGSWHGYGAGSINDPNQETGPAETDPFPGVPSNETARCNNGAIGTRTWTVPSSTDSGGSETYYFCYSQFQAHTHFNYNGTAGGVLISADETSFPAVLLTKIILPNNTSYSFQYDPNFLDLTRIDLPTGGFISYIWTLANWDECSTAAPIKRVVGQRTVNPGGGNPSSVWQYKWSNESVCDPEPGASIGVIVTHPDLNDEWHPANSGGNPNVSNGLVLTEDVYYYQGLTNGDPSNIAGHLLKKVETTSLAKQSIFYMSNPETAVQDPQTGDINWQPGNSIPELFPGPVEKTVTTLYDPSSGQVQSSQEIDTPSLPSTGSLDRWNPDDYNVPANGHDTCACLNYSEIQTERDYDVVQGGGSGPGSLLKRIEMSYRFQNPSDGQTYASAGLTSLPSSMTIYDGAGNQAAQTTYSYDESNNSAGVIAGELTTTSRMLSGGSISTHNKFNSSGVSAGSIDGKGNSTNVTSYDCSGLFPSGITQAAGTPVALNSTYSHDCNTGKVTGYTDANGQQTAYHYADTLSRLTSIDYPDGGHTGIVYSDTATPSVTTTTSATPNPNITKTYVFDGLGRQTQLQQSDPQGTINTDTAYDPMGRTLSVSNPYRNTNDSTYGFTSYRYDAIGRTLLQCQPDNGTPSNGCSAGASYLEWSYNGNVVDSYDEVRNHWRRTYDGLGRLTHVTEPDPDSNNPSLETVYTYNAMSDLLQIDQWGGSVGTSGERQRIFKYDSLSRLTSAYNPESGTICYGAGSSCASGYDNNGNLLMRTDARGITTYYSYDALNRLTGKTYSDSTPPVAYHYDEPTIPWLSQPLTNAKGKLSSAYVGGTNIYSRYAYGYDAVGRLRDKFITPTNAAGNGLASASGGVSNHYDLAGNVTFIDNGSGGYTYIDRDSAGHAINVTANAFTTHQLNGVMSHTIFTNGQYNALGQPSSRLLGNGFTELRAYDSRGRLQTLGETTATTSPYFTSTQYLPNGNVQSSTDSVNGVWTYQYDHLNRLKTATNTQSGLVLSWGYDVFGNRTSQTPSGSGSAPQLSLPLDNLNDNRFDQSTHVIAYDVSGNVTYDNTGPAAMHGGNNYTYNAEGRISSLTAGASPTKYLYDADGSLVYENSPQGTQIILRDIQGHPVVNTSFSGQPYQAYRAYVDGELLGSSQNSTFFWAANDWLGTKRYESAGLGDGGTAVSVNPKSYTSLPFGDALNAVGQDPIHFTGKERDQGSGLDNFGARYFGSSMGRFMSPDFGGPMGESHPDPILWADLENPQTLNLYSYGNNNPVSNVDEDGHDVSICDDTYHNCHTVSNEEYQKAQQGNNGSLNVPTLDQVGMNGDGNGQFNATNITDSKGNTVGTATYVSKGGADYYANRTGIDFINRETAPVVNTMAGITVGAVGVMTGAEVVGATSELTLLGDITLTPTAGETASAERVFAQGGRRSVERAIRTLSKRLAEHQDKLGGLKGNSGSVEKEIATFSRQIEALKSVLK